MGRCMEWHWIRSICPRLPTERHARAQHRDFRVSPFGAQRSCIPAGRKTGGLGLDVPQRHACWGGNTAPAAFGRERGRDAGMSRLRLAVSPHSVIGKRRASRKRHRRRIRRPHRGARPILSVARQPPRRVSLGLGVCDSLRRVRNNTPVCPETYRHDPPGRDIVLGLVVVLWRPPVDLDLEIITTNKDRVSSSGAAHFVAGRHLSDNLYWVAVSRALSSASTSASVDSRRYGVLALYCTKPALSSTPLGIGTNRCHWRSGRAGDRLSKHGVLAA